MAGTVTEAALDATADEAFDRIDSGQGPWFGVRFFLVHAEQGRLFAPFTVDDDTAFPNGWVRARCRPEVAPVKDRSRRFDPVPHEVPGADCGCGFRVYPDVVTARDALELWPAHADLRRSDIALAVVEFDGGVATRPGGCGLTDDEAGTLRVEWLRVAGPVAVSTGLSRQARRGLVRRYALDADALVRVDRPVAESLRDGTLDEVLAAGRARCL